MMEDSGPSRENLMWTEPQMDYSVHLLVDQSRIPGMKSGGGMKAKVYTAIEKNMIDFFGREFTKDKIKNKLKYAKPNLTVMKDILNTSGFGYDPLNKCIDVDPQVWAEYIEKYPNRKTYKGPRLWRYYDEFLEVYRDSCTPRTGEELFNHRHSSLRNTVERTFGLLKGRFPILKTQVQYPFKKQVQIVLATCVLHNFIIEQNPDAEQFVDEDVPSTYNVFLNDLEVTTQIQQRGSNNPLRTAITTHMFAHYNSSRQRR